MELSNFTFKNISCTLDFSPPKYRVFDSSGQIIDLYRSEYPIYRIESFKQISLSSSENENSNNIVIRANQYGQADKQFDDISAFANRFSELFSRFANITNEISINRIGVRLFYEVQIADDGQFVRLKEYFSLPGADDPRVQDLVHYNISLENFPYRTIITIGQNRQGAQVFMSPDLNGMFFQRVALPDIQRKIVDLYTMAIKTFSQFVKEE